MCAPAAGIQYLLPATWSALSQRNMTDLKELAQLLSTSPAALANLQDRKGSIKPGEQLLLHAPCLLTTC